MVPVPDLVSAIPVTVSLTTPLTVRGLAALLDQVCEPVNVTFTPMDVGPAPAATEMPLLAGLPLMFEALIERPLMPVPVVIDDPAASAVFEPVKFRLLMVKFWFRAVLKF